MTIARYLRSLLALLSLPLVAACTGDIGTSEDEARNLPFGEGSPEAHAILAVVNDPSQDLEAFDVTIGLDRRAANNLMAARGQGVLTTLGSVYSVSYCKTVCLRALLEYAKAHGLYQLPEVQVLFSPTEIESSHLARVAEWIDEATDSIDIAMYSYSRRDPIRSALERATERGVVIRMLADNDLAKNDSKCGELEAMGIDVRRVTKIMHHKAMIVDGPRSNDVLERAVSARIATGSANWSSSAATRYDENTLFIEGHPALTLRMQEEFDTLWAGSKDVVYEALEWDTTRAESLPEHMPIYGSEGHEVFFTSENFAPTSSSGWSKQGTTVVTDKLVEAIGQAEHTLQIASGHFVSLPIAEAVMAAIDDNPSLEVDIVLDCQEVSKSGAIKTLKNSIEAHGGRIAYKCNTYRWHYKYAQQMHHKYMIIDGHTLYSGSLNFSDNAETNTFENMFRFSGEGYAELIEAFEENFNLVRSYGSDDDWQSLEKLRADILEGSSVPLHWYSPVSVTRGTFEQIKSLIRSECPSADAWGSSGPSKTYKALFNEKPEWFESCSKTGYPWPKVPVSERL